LGTLFLLQTACFIQLSKGDDLPGDVMDL
jgi:hypothetical protein